MDFLNYNYKSILPSLFNTIYVSMFSYWMGNQRQWEVYEDIN